MRRTLAIMVAVRGGNRPPHVRSVPLDPSPRSLTRRDPVSVAVSTTAKPPRPYVEVSALTGRSGNGEQDLGEMQVAETMSPIFGRLTPTPLHGSHRAPF